MSGKQMSVVKSAVFKEENAKVALSIVVFAENEQDMICMNGVIMPVADLLGIVTCNSIRGGVTFTSASGNSYSIPFINPEHLSSAIIAVRS